MPKKKAWLTIRTLHKRSWNSYKTLKTKLNKKILEADDFIKNCFLFFIAILHGARICTVAYILVLIEVFKSTLFNFIKMSSRSFYIIFCCKVSVWIMKRETELQFEICWKIGNCVGNWKTSSIFISLWNISQDSFQCCFIICFDSQFYFFFDLKKLFSKFTCEAVESFSCFAHVFLRWYQEFPKSFIWTFNQWSFIVKNVVVKGRMGKIDDPHR